MPTSPSEGYGCHASTCQPRPAAGASSRTVSVRSTAVAPASAYTVSHEHLDVLAGRGLVHRPRGPVLDRGLEPGHGQAGEDGERPGRPGPADRRPPRPRPRPPRPRPPPRPRNSAGGGARLGRVGRAAADGPAVGVAGAHRGVAGAQERREGLDRLGAEVRRRLRVLGVVRVGARRGGLAAGGDRRLDGRPAGPAATGPAGAVPPTRTRNAPGCTTRASSSRPSRTAAAGPRTCPGVGPACRGRSR